jgi:OPT family oligopeptide transporter
MSLEEKDEWWLKNVYRGDMPQLTLRSALTGVLLGGILSLTNLYVGIRTGWSLGVGITSVILAFAAFKLLSKIGLGTDLTILENNAMQSIATSAGYMTSPLVAFVPAYMLVTNRPIPWWQVIPWMVCISTMGALFAFPLKKRFINDEQLSFPEGYAAGVVMDNLHGEGGAVGLFKAKVLGAGAAISAFIQLIRSEKVMAALRAPFLTLPEYWDDLVYKIATPRLMGVRLVDLNIQLDSSIVMLGTGGLMGVKAGASLLVGAFVNYFLLAPWLMSHGIIAGTGFRAITKWSLWWGVAMMTTASLYSFFSRPELLVSAFRGMFKPRAAARRDAGAAALRQPQAEAAPAAAPRGDVLGHIELPLKVSLVGIPILGTIVVLMGMRFFGITWWMGALAIPLVFVFAIIAVNSTGLTSITPIGAMGKLTQLTYGAIAPGNMTTNLATAGITADVVSSASNLLMDIKPGYMLGAKPRQQAIGHVLGILAGSLVAVPVFYAIFQGDVSRLTVEPLVLPAAQVWRAVAELLAKGFSSVHESARWAMLVGGVLGVVFEAANQRMKGRFPLSGVGVGLATVVTFPDCLSMGLGALGFWFLGTRFKDPARTGHRVFVENRETLCAGIIAGGALIGIALILLETVVLR